MASELALPAGPLELPEGVAAVRLPAAGRVSNDDLARLAGELSAADVAGRAAIVVAGEGADFCAGRALPPEAEHAGPDGPGGLEQRNAAPVLHLLAALDAVRAPVIAVVAGRAFGLGCALAAACDLTLASDQARFCLPELRHGIPPTLALSVLRRVVAPKALVDLVLSSAEIGAERAAALGIVTAVAPPEGLAAALEELLAPLRAAPLASRAVKRYLRAARTLDDRAAAELASSLLAGVLAARPAPAP